MSRPEAPIWLLLAACTEPPDNEVVVLGDPVPVVSRPLVGGRAASPETWEYVVASDEDGDRIVIHPLYEPEPVDDVVVQLPSGWAPGAVTAIYESGNTSAVVAQGAGALVIVNFVDPVEVEVLPVCDEPRGITSDGYQNAWVACADGQLVGVDLLTKQVVHRWYVAPDLAHVAMDNNLYVLAATARDGEVLRVQPLTGEIVERYTLPTLPSPDGHTLVSRVVRRMVYTDDDMRVLVLHQAHVTDPLPVDLDGTPAYGTGACLSVARPLLTWIRIDGQMDTVRVDAVLPLDVNLWPEGDGAFPVPTPVIGAVDVGAGPGLQSVYPAEAMSDPAEFCVPRNLVTSTEGPVVGVAMDIEGPLAVTRNPFAIVRMESGVVSLRENPPDAGLRLFHAPSPSGVTCASCHALGRDDGHTWDFVGFGPRRTQSLAGGLDGTAPYHWDGAFPDLATLFADTGVGRMGHSPVPQSDIDALAAWLDQLPTPVGPPGDPAAVTWGEGIFIGLGCVECHPAPTYTDNSTKDVGTGGPFQVPSLRGLSTRLPWMHDGCAVTPEDRFDAACGGTSHGNTDNLNPQALADLVAFLGSL